MEKREVEEIVEDKVKDKFERLGYDYHFKEAMKSALLDLLDDYRVKEKIKDIVS